MGRLFLAVVVTLSTDAQAAGWPDGYTVHDGTQSPDGHYGIAVPSTGDDTSENVNYFADLKKRQVLGKIRCSDYFENQNHRSLNVIWASDSSWCVADYNDRFGFSDIAILEANRSGMEEIDIGKRIYHALKSATGEDGYASAYFRPTAGRTLLVRSLLFTGNPKMNDKSTRYARLEGSFELSSGKWTKMEARRMKLPLPKGEGEVYSAAFLALGSAYAETPDSPGTALDTEQAERLDGTMNEVYEGLRVVLPPERFEKVKSEQIAWLKKRDAVSSTEEKCKLLKARIKALQDLLW